MPITWGNASSSGNFNNVNTSYSWSHTTSALTDCLVVIVSGVDGTLGDRDITGITFNSVALTAGPSADNAAGGVRIEVWYLTETAYGSGLGGVTANIEVTHGGKCTDACGHARDLRSVNQSAPVQAPGTNTGSNSDPTITISGAISGSATFGGTTISEADPAQLSVSVGGQFGETDMGADTSSAARIADTGTLTWAHTTDDEEWAVAAINFSEAIAGVSVTPAAATMVAGRVNPTVVKGSLAVSPSARTAIAASVNPTVVKGSLSIAPAVLSAVAASVDPTVATGPVTVTPTAASAIAATVDPVFVAGSVAVAPSAGGAIAATVDPTTIKGSLSISPSALSAIAASVDPAVVIGGGGVTVAPAAATAVAASVAPTIVKGSLSIAPSTATAIAATVDPTALEGSLSITPAVASAIAASVAPAVIRGSITITPAVGFAVAASVAPVFVAGSISVAPAAGWAIAATIDPTVIRGSIAVAPAASWAIAASVDPTVIAGGGVNVLLTPAAATAVAATVNPQVVLGSIVIAPGSATVVAAAVFGTYRETLGEIYIVPAPDRIFTLPVPDRGYEVSAVDRGYTVPIFGRVHVRGDLWWEALGVDFWAVYEPYGAASFADSLQDRSGSGNNAIDPGGAYTPSWSAVNGWTFTAAQYLMTAFLPGESQENTLLVQFTGGNGIMMVETLYAGQFGFISFAGALLSFANGENLVSPTLPPSDGNFAIAGAYGYLNGILDAGPIGDYSNPMTDYFYIAMRNHFGVPEYVTGWSGTIKSLILSKSALTKAQVIQAQAVMRSRGA